MTSDRVKVEELFSVALALLVGAKALFSAPLGAVDGVAWRGAHGGGNASAFANISAVAVHSTTSDRCWRRDCRNSGQTEAPAASNSGSDSKSIASLLPGLLDDEVVLPLATIVSLQKNQFKIALATTLHSVSLAKAGSFRFEERHTKAEITAHCR